MLVFFQQVRKLRNCGQVYAATEAASMYSATTDLSLTTFFFTLSLSSLSWGEIYVGRWHDWNHVRVDLRHPHIQSTLQSCPRIKEKNQCIQHAYIKGVRRLKDSLSCLVVVKVGRVNRVRQSQWLSSSKAPCPEMLAEFHVCILICDHFAYGV